MTDVLVYFEKVIIHVYAVFVAWLIPNAPHERLQVQDRILFGSTEDRTYMTTLASKKYL